MSLLLSCLVGVFLSPYLASALNVALPAIGAEFHLSATGLGAVSAAFVVATALVLVPLGRIGVRVGQRRVFLIGVAAVGATAVAVTMAPSGSWLIAARAAQGLASACLYATGMVRLVNASAPARRGQVMGLGVAMIYAGLSVGPLLGGALNDFLGWRWVLWAVLPLCLLALLLERRNPPERAEDPGLARDWPGLALFLAAVGGAVAGLLLVPGPWALPALALALAAGLLLVRLERGHPAPVVDVAAWRGNRVYALGNLAALVSYGATAGVGFLLSLYLQFNAGLDARHAGLALIVQPLVQALVSPLAGRWADRTSPRRLATAGMAATTLGLIGLALLPERGALLGALAVQVVLGLGIALFSSPNSSSVLGAVERERLSMASAMLSTMRTLGMMISMALVLLVFRLLLDGRVLSRTEHAGFATTVSLLAWIFAGLCAFGTLAAWRARGPCPRHPAEPGAVASARLETVQD